MIVFFIRSYNDIDHMVPIIFRLALAGEAVGVFCQNPGYDIAGDFRLRYLCDRFANIVVRYVHEAHFLATSLLPFDEEWVGQWLKRLKAAVLVFDAVIAPTQFFTGSLLQAARDLHIPTVGIVPGVPLFAGDYIPAAELYQQEVLTEFDYTIVPHAGAAAYRELQGVEPERIAVLGSPRFCPEWQQVLYSIVESVEPPTPAVGDRLRVVYMERGADLHGAFREVIGDTLQRLSRLYCIQLVVKPHPRTNCFQMEAMTDTAMVISRDNSSNLIRWADVVIGTNTSILIEVLQRDKVLLYPKYFHLHEYHFLLPHQLET